MNAIANREGSWRAFRAALNGALPGRYADDFFAPFNQRALSAIHEGAQVLDVGSGRRPTLPLSERPPGTRYVGLDVSSEELARAPAGAYDETVVADAADHLPSLEGQFDLIVSWDMLEHVADLGLVLSNLRSYLRPGGRLVAQFAGRYSAHAVLNRIVPHRVTVWAMERLLQRPPDTVFEGRYDRCHYGALERLLEPFGRREIFTHYRDAGYFAFSRIARALYLAYEEWAFTGGHRNLASHYLVCAER